MFLRYLYIEWAGLGYSTPRSVQQQRVNTYRQERTANMTRTISGIVNPSGEVASGKGFKVDKTDTGLNTIMFLERF